MATTAPGTPWTAEKFSLALGARAQPVLGNLERPPSNFVDTSVDSLGLDVAHLLLEPVHAVARLLEQVVHLPITLFAVGATGAEAHVVDIAGWLERAEEVSARPRKEFASCQAPRDTGGPTAVDDLRRTRGNRLACLAS